MGFDRVADRDDADQRAVFHDRHVPHAVFGHHAHDVFDCVVERAGNELRAHAVGGDQLVERRRPRRAGAEDVAFGDDADHLAQVVVFADHERADVVAHELLHDFIEVGLRMNRKNLRPLDAQNFTERHNRALPTGKNEMEKDSCNAASQLLLDGRLFSLARGDRNCQRNSGLVKKITKKVLPGEKFGSLQRD